MGSADVRVVPTEVLDADVPDAGPRRDRGGVKVVLMTRGPRRRRGRRRHEGGSDGASVGGHADTEVEARPPRMSNLALWVIGRELILDVDRGPELRQEAA